MTAARSLAVDEVLDLHSDRVLLEPLVAAVVDDDVEIGVFTDEELAWTAPDPGQRRGALLDEPRLSGLDDEHRDVALASTMWSLVARGAATWDGRSLQVHGVLAVLADLRFDADAAISVRTQTRTGGRDTRQAAFYRARPDLFVVEQVAPEGLHRLVASSAARAAARLAGLLDPLHRAAQTVPVATAARSEELSASTDALAMSADSAAVAVAGDRDGRQRAVTTYGDGDGLWVLHGVEGPGDDAGEVALQRLAPDDLVAYAAAFLAPEPDPAGGVAAHGGRW